MIRTLLFGLCCLFLINCSQPDQTLLEPAADQLFRLKGDMAGSQIVVAWKGSSGSAQDLARTREQAQAKAQQLASALRQDPGLFELLARQESDGPESDRGGRLGTWPVGALASELEDAFNALEIGGVSPEPISSPFGWHLLRRDPLCVPHYGFEAFYIACKGSEETPAIITRDREAARKLAARAAKRLSPKNFPGLASRLNDFADGPLPLEVFTIQDNLPPELMETLSGLDFGDVAGPIELPVGFGFYRRVRLQQRAGAHILISFREARAAAPGVSRTRTQAKELLMELLSRLSQNPDQFGQLANQFSDAPDAARFGNLGVWYRGSMAEEFEMAVDLLAIGQISTQAVETGYGYHLIQRLAVPSPCSGADPMDKSR